MNKVQKKIVELLKFEIFGEKLSEVCLSEEEYYELFDEAKAQYIECIIYDGVLSLISNNPRLCDLLNKWKMHVLMRTTSHKYHCRNILSIPKALKNAKIPYVMLKGYNYKLLYPKPEMRYMGDLDLYVDNKNFDRASELLIDNGYIGEENPTHLYHVGYSKGDEIEIELHYNFVSKVTFNGESFLEENVWKNLNYINVDNFDISVPMHELNIVYTVLHIVAHFTGSGFGLRQLSDFALYLENYEKEMSMNQVKLILEKYNCVKIYGYLVEICNEFFDKNYCKLGVEIEGNVMSSIVDLMFDSGVFGQKSRSNELKRFLAKEKIEKNIKSNNSLRLKCLALFPKVSQIGKRYKYAQKYRLLLPIAWIHRIIHGFFNPSTTSNELLFGKVDVKIINTKVELMEYFDFKMHG